MKAFQIIALLTNLWAQLIHGYQYGNKRQYDEKSASNLRENVKKGMMAFQINCIIDCASAENFHLS